MTAIIEQFPAQRIQTVGEMQARLRWANLTKELREWLWEPDIEAFQIALAVAVSHYFKHDQPVWLMILGPSASGKTTILTMLDALDEARSIDDLTPKTLLSGFNTGNSLLHQIGTEEDRSAILLMADFSTITSMRDDAKREIASQFRKVYDGKYIKQTGVGKTLEWEGKVTMIVGATPAAERSWGVMRDLGERFMQVRWPRGDGVEQARTAAKQIGRETEALNKLRNMTRGFVDVQAMAKEMQAGDFVRTSLEVVENGIAPLAEVVAILRGHVERDWSKKEISEVSEPEGPTRIMKAMSQVARASAAMFRRHEISRDDLRLAKRLAMDCVPPQRRLILNHLLAGPIGWAQLARSTGLPPTSMTRYCEDMEALGIVEKSEKVEVTYTLTSRFEESLRRAAPLVNL